MTPKEYNDMPEGDTKLAVRCAITCGWVASLQHSIEQNGLRVFVEDPAKDGWKCARFNPFTDPSIPYGLIGRGVTGVSQSPSGGFFARSGRDMLRYSFAIRESKTHAIINAFCAADPQGHWARFMKGGEV